jgi:hypothetical protein
MTLRVFIVVVLVSIGALSMRVIKLDFDEFVIA